MRPSDPAGPHPLTAARSAAHTAPAAPQTLSLLAARPLTLNTRPLEGTASPAAARPAARPVVAPRWPGTPTASAQLPATASGAPATSHSAAPHTRRSGPPAAARSTPAQPLAPRAQATSHTSAPPAPHAAVPATSPSTAPPALHAGPPPALRGTPESPRSTPSRSPGAPAAPPIQRASAVNPGSDGPFGAQGPGLRTTGSAASAQRLPVVRPGPPRSETPESGVLGPSGAVPARALPVTGPQAPPLRDRPAGTAAPAPAGNVPVVRWQRGGTAAPVQRAGTGAGDVASQRVPGVPAKGVPARGRPRSASASGTSSASGKNAARRDGPSSDPPDPGLDLDDLARRLLDPVGRLLRAELRRGRDRTGRPHDGRR
ncbi:hypothetical protein ACGFZB_26405 [Streptomyces cinerochromogenes]|uniref:Syndecan 1 n=1 Tax=Streptomyces cinerochromogenes TaxID=66422 RepID=A0ABW7B9T1_9ACTN